MKKIPSRIGVAAMIFMSTFVAYMIRSQFPISVLAMIQPNKDGKVFVPECLLGKGNQTNKNKTVKNDGTRYEWAAHVEGALVASYFYGYTIGCLPAGIIVETIGPWNTVFYSTLISIVFTVLGVPAAPLGWGAVLGTRVILGLCGGLIYPALQNLIAHWAPPNEKGRFVACLMGNTIGTVATQPLVALLTEDLHDWAFGFYFVAIALALYLIPWWFLVSDTPQKHRWTSDEEKQFIEESLQGRLSSKKSIPPYLKILLSCPCWATFLSQFGNMWGLILLQTNGPKYLVQVLGFDLKESGGLAALPYLARLGGGFAFGSLGDFLRKRTSLSVTKIRKLAIIFSHLIPGALMGFIWFAGCNSAGAVALLIISLGFNGSVCMGHLQNVQDLAPNYVATIYGLMTFIGGIPGLFVTSVTAQLTKKHNGVHEWAIVFVLGGSAYFLCGVFFLIFGSGELQSWNQKPDDPDAAGAPK